MMPSILVVEDEPAIQELLRVNLEDAGFTVRTVADAEAALVQIKRALPDLLLLDWMLPGQSGLALARGLRGEARTRELPIIMVTARGDEADRVAGLEAWVDDYVTKPFSPRELKARIKAVLRRRAPSFACSNSSWRGPSGCTAGRSSSIRSGATMCISRNVPSTCTSAACASRSSRTPART
jgi:two-component system phosphate regulon response regulator PhoB